MKYQTAVEALKNNPVVHDEHDGGFIVVKGLVEIRGEACAIIDLTGLNQSINAVERDSNGTWVLTKIGCGIGRFYGKGSPDEDVREFNESCVFKDNHITQIEIF
jgi:hydrogenase maturation factor